MQRNELFTRTLGVVAAFSLLRQPGLLILPLAALKPAAAWAADPHAGHNPVAAAASADKSQPKAAGKPVYQCPMHPQIVRDHPGTCPICYMDLEKVDLDQSDAVESAAPAGVAGKSGFRLSAERQQLIGVKTAVAAKAALTRELRLAGRAGGGAVLAQLQELDAGALKPGQQGWIVGPGQGTVKARVQAVDSQLDAYTRSFAVRVQPAQQPAWLRGGIYVDVHIVVPVGQGLAVPREAVFDTGERKVAFVRKGDRFEPRELRLGAAGDDKVLVLDGVKEGEEVVIAANFLIDSEARFRAVAEQYR